MKIQYFLAYTFLLFLAACGNQTSSNSNDTFAKHSTQKQIFQRLDNTTIGVDFQNKLIENSKINGFNFSYLYNGGAVALGDINNDKLVDVYMVSINGANKLFLNKGNMKFEDITAAAGVAAADGTKMGVTMVDVNNDGYLDIYQCRSGLEPNLWNNLLFINQKDNTFKESAIACGLNDNAPSNNANFFDYDNDGDLDMYLLNHPMNFETVNNVRVMQQPDGKIKRTELPDQAFESDKMYKNNGNGTFVEVTVQAGVVNRAFGLSSSVGDFNEDGFQDIYICNDYAEPDFLYINNKNGSFTNKIADYMQYYTNNSMGSDFADINNDGLLDLISLDMLPEDNMRQKVLKTSMQKERYNLLVRYEYGKQLMRNMLHINTGKGFSEVACLAGISATDWSWSPLVQDFDNDGWKDISITNGYFHDVNNQDYMNFTLDSLKKITNGEIAKLNIEAMEKIIPKAKLRNYMYRNNGNLTFEDVSDAWGMTEKTFSNGSAYADLDNDGDMDLVVNNINDLVSVYENKSRQELPLNNYLQINFEGNTKNTKAVGSKVSILYGGKQQYEELRPTRGFLSSSEHLLHFGLGTTQKIDEIQVVWFDGKITQLKDVATNQRLTLKYTEAKVGKFPKENSTPIFAAANNTGIDFKHAENDFDDFNREFLLPHKLSTQGPCLATGDVNNDGLEDFYIGGATGNAGCLYLQNTNSAFAKGSMATWEMDKNYEDTGAIFFDADADKDLDLYVVSGDNVNIAGTPLYQDRLYINDGKGNFTKNASALPNLASSKKAITAFDYDKDGDLDIFLGGRTNTGRYPTAPMSYILQNNAGKFKDVTASVAPEFQNIGMITDLTNADIDKDGSSELIAVGEWMPLTIFKYDGSKYKNVTADFGLSETTGWWNCLKINDLDNDGDMDIVAGNLGFNTRYQANTTQPLQLFYKDFDNNGSAEPILAWYKQGKCHPVALRDEFVKQMPSFKKKYLHYRDYGQATMSDIFGSDLKSAQNFNAKTLATTYFENIGNGKFTIKELPIEAQVAPVFDIAITDFNNDNIKDLILVGNSSAEWTETGPINASNGVLLVGDGKNSFITKRNLDVGFWANKEARKIGIVTLANKKQLYIVANNNDLVQTFVK
jgi:enediyne biosynthesis protein E4